MQEDPDKWQKEILSPQLSVALALLVLGSLKETTNASMGQPSPLGLVPALNSLGWIVQDMCPSLPYFLSRGF